jgi:uncharacterized protein (DUF736 family)
MTTIGTFTQQNGGYTGSVRTLTVNVKVKIVPNEKAKEKSPDFRILSGNYEIGAAWKNTAQNSQREYLAVTLDDPSFPSTLYARLVEDDENAGYYVLIWSRNKND